MGKTYIDYIFQGFGVFLGVVAGVSINLLVQWINERRKELQKVKNLKFEFEINIRKIDGWIDELSKYRNAVNGDALDRYFGYFDLSRFIVPTANDMFFSGLLYKYLDKDDIGRLQIIYTEFSVNGEKILNEQIDFFRNKAIGERVNWPRLKKEVVGHIDFYDNKFKEHKKTLEYILGKLAKFK